MLGLMLAHHPHGLLADLYWVLASSCHRPILSGVGASNIPGAVQPSDLSEVSRLALRSGTTHRAYLHLDEFSPKDWRKLLEVVERAADVRSMLFARAVVLTEGETEMGAIPVWYEKSQGHLLETQGIQVFSVGGKGSFETLVRYLTAFDIRWAIVCDGMSIGDTGEPPIVQQLRNAGVESPTRDWTDSFPERKARLEDYGVFSVASTASGDGEGFERLDVIRKNRRDVPDWIGRSKPRIGRYIAEEHNCPTELVPIFAGIRQHLGIS